MHPFTPTPRFASLITILLLAFGGPAARAASTVTDPAGDYVQGSPCGGIICEPWQDITQASITHAAGGLQLAMSLLSPIPAAPYPAASVKLMVWAWRLNTDPNASPSGFPLPAGVDSPFEVIVQLRWEAGQFSGQLIDRRPMLSGGSATITPLAVNVSGATLGAFVSDGSIALPSSFQWRASTNVFMGKEGSMGQYPVDQTAFTTLNPGD